MVSTRGVIIGVLIIVLGVFVILTFTSMDFLWSIGIQDMGTINTIQEQWSFWGPAIGIAVIIAGLVAMGKFE